MSIAQNVLRIQTQNDTLTVANRTCQTSVNSLSTSVKRIQDSALAQLSTLQFTKVNQSNFSATVDTIMAATYNIINTSLANASTAQARLQDQAISDAIKISNSTCQNSITTLSNGVAVSQNSILAQIIDLQNVKANQTSLAATADALKSSTMAYINSRVSIYKHIGCDNNR